MEMKLKKLWPLFGAMCVSLFSSAYADPSHSYNGSGSTNSMQQSGQGTYQRGSYREITPNAGPRVAHGADVFITADFIWWKATQEGLEYASTGVSIGGADPNDVFANVPTGKTASVGKDWAPGFKVGLGLNLSHDGWDLYAQYTWLHASDHSSLSRANDQVSVAYLILGNDGPTVSADRVSSNWDLHFNVIDLELGRNFYLSQFLTMRPFIGFKGTWQDQDQKTRAYSNNFVIDVDNGNDVAVTGPARSHLSTDVWGIGVRGGLNVSWYMAKSWSIYGDLAWTTMWTDYSTLKRRDSLDDTTTGNSKTLTSINSDDFYTVNYVGEAELGLRWEMWFYDDNYHFAIQAGWEQQVWLNWGRFEKLLVNDLHGDLNFHGLNLKFRFDF